MTLRTERRHPIHMVTTLHTSHVIFWFYISRDSVHFFISDVKPAMVPVDPDASPRLNSESSIADLVDIQEALREGLALDIN
ncbi:hypothetical protein RRG08_011008 [Elysia crispata]|uniref:Uncharacterized protein n=1 Tax=Elysia crispata TaxID=231223 RepID=A0AAE0ZQX0_9GAST|nr:hypothetical protein RRG08_011008 [Elysia crispata]